jgi:hypothetical protein
MTKKSTLTQLRTVELADKLRAVCHKAEDGLAQYEFGWDDHKLANNLGISPHNVQSIRLRLIGRTRAETVGTTTTTHLLKRIEALEAWAKARPVAPFKDLT